MLSQLTQLILAARNGEEDAGWMQLLVFIVIGTIYALSSIVKAKTKKIDLDNEKPSASPPQPKPKPSQIKKHQLHQLRPQQQTQIQAHITPEIKPMLPQPPEKPKKIKPAARKTKKIDDFLLAPPKSPQLDLKDQQTLKKAILYHEIIGKPIGLKKP